MSVPRQETVFEERWRLIQEGQLAAKGDRLAIYPVYVNKKHGIMAVCDPYAKFSDQFVIALAAGNSGVRTSFYELKPSLRLQLHLVADTICEVILVRQGANAVIEELPRNKAPIEHIEGNSVQDHPHIVVAAVHRHEGVRLYGAEPKVDVPKPEITDAVLAETRDYFADALLHTDLDAQLDALAEIAPILDH